MLRWLSPLLLAAMGNACSTTYQPRSDGRVGVVIHSGTAAYVQAGKEVPIGPFGGDLEQLVAADQHARASARRSRHQLQAGVPSYVGGLAGVVVGLALSGPIGWVAIGVGAAAAGSGLGLLGAGFTNAVDAVNIYNDTISAPPASHGADPGEPRSRRIP